MKHDNWIHWVEQIRAIAQNGLTFGKGPFDIERYQQLKDIAHQMTALLTGAPAQAVEQYFLPDTGYATPKLDVRGGVFHQNRILLVKERSDGRWALPGGWADIGESPSLSAIREIMEESGYKASVVKLVAVRDVLKHPYYPRAPSHIIKLLFLCELESETPVIPHEANNEISDVDYFLPDQLPPLSEGRTIKADIDLLLRHNSNPTLPTEYD